MNRISRGSFNGLLACVVALAGFCSVRLAQANPAAQSPAGATVRAIGTVQSVQGSAITLKTDAGTQVEITVQNSSRLLRIQPGQKNLKDAMPLKLPDLQTGDRILVLGVMPAGSKSVLASSIIAIKSSDLALRQQQEEEAWEKNGAGGIVRSVDPETGAITLAPNAAGKTVNITTTKQTIFRRYAPGSVRFQDAKASTLAEIKPGDQLRARGTLSTDGEELAAVEIVSGTFENIAGTVLSVDPDSNRLMVLDLMTKHPVSVTVSPSSELRQLPESQAQEIAMRVHNAQKPSARSSGAPPAAGPSLDQLLKQLPPIPLSDLRKGDMVMIVSTEGTTPGSSTAIKLVSGVAPILTASRGGNQGKTLQSLWSGFGSTAGGDESEGAGGGGGAAPRQK